MNAPRALGIVSLSMLLLAGRAWAQPGVTMAEIQADFDSAKYQEVVRKTQTALNLRGNQAVGLDRAQLQALRGESYLQLKQNANAATAFTAAVKETTDSTKSGLWTATALLINRSPGGKYSPKQAGAGGAKAGPIDILPAETRKEAFLALFTDELKVATPKIQAAAKQTALQPLAAGIKTAGEVRNLEVAATGKDDTIKAMISELGTRASTLMLDEVRKMSAEVEKINGLANQSTADPTYGQQPGVTQYALQKRGLISTDSRTLQEVMSTTTQIGKACDELSVAIGSDKVFTAVKDDAARLSQRAYDVLNADYSGNRANVRPTTPTVPRGRTGTGTGTTSGGTR